MTVEAWARAWLEQEQGRWKRRTRRTYASVLRMYVLPTLGPQALDAVTRREVRALGEALRARGLRSGTVRLALATVRGLLQAAVEAEVLRENPAQRLGRLVVERRDAQAVHCPTQAEVQQMLEVAEAQAPQWFPLLLCLARTGLRIGEACGLQWADLDLDARTAVVQRTVGDGNQSDSPKSGAARTVDLSSQLVDVLRRVARDGDYVFRRETRDTPVDQRLVNAALRECAQQAGVGGYWTAHQLRHAYASALVSAGVPLEYIARQLGHSSTLLISRIYGRHLPFHNHPAVDALDHAS